MTHWLYLAAAALAGYFAVGVTIAIIAASAWNPQAGQFDAAPIILLWPVSVVLFVKECIADAFNGLCSQLSRLAMKEGNAAVRHKPQPLLSRLRVFRR